MDGLVGKDTPNITYGTQEDYRRLYKSDPKAAITADITLQAGYGQLRMGTVLAKNNSAAGNDGKFIPYDPTATITAKEVAPGRAYLVSNTTGAEVLSVTIPDSYKFLVGDDLIVVDSDGEGNSENLGAIVEIDRTTYSSYAVITVTETISDTFTTAKFAYVVVEGYNTAVGILEKSITAGEGATAAGALASIILSNALLYTGILLNLDSNAQTDLSTTSFGQYTVLK